MKILTTSALLAIALGLGIHQPSFAQDQGEQPSQQQNQDQQNQDQQNQDQQNQDQREQDQQEQRRERDQDQRRERQRGSAVEDQRNRDGQRQRDQRQRGDERQRDQRQRDGRTSQQGRRGQVTGEIVKLKRVDVRGTDQQRLVVLLKTDSGDRVPVDLGLVNRLGPNAPQIGDEIRIRGRLIHIGDRAVVIGEQFQGRDRRVVRIDQRDPRSQRNRPGSGQQSRGGLGVMLDSEPAENGVRVMRVLRGSPADRSGIRPGDVITEIDGNTVSTPRDLMRAVIQRDPGEQVRITIERNGETRQVTPQLTSRQEALEPGSQEQNRDRRRQPR